VKPHGKAKLFGKQNRSVFAPLALVDPDAQTVNVYIITKEPAELGNSKAGEVRETEEQGMLGVAASFDSTEERRKLLVCQVARQLLGWPRVSELCPASRHLGHVGQLLVAQSIPADDGRYLADGGFQWLEFDYFAFQFSGAHSS
jgi:hypothetical protein